MQRNSNPIFQPVSFILGTILLKICFINSLSIQFQQAWKWGGCSADINYGMRFSRKFLDVREIEGDTRSLMNLQNNKVGRKVSVNYSPNFLTRISNNWQFLLPVSQTPSQNRLQMPRRVRLLCYEDVLEDIAELSSSRRHFDAQIQQSALCGCSSCLGTGPGEAATTDLQTPGFASKEDCADPETAGVSLY